jgi:hypothetical protein
MAAILSLARGGKFSAASRSALKWCEQKALPNQLVELFNTAAPQTEVWAGAGALYPMRSIIRWNDDFPAVLAHQLLIVGSAANGDHICIDLKNGEVGYVSHEHGWEVKQPRRYFIAVSPSIGKFLKDSNATNLVKRLPADYWEAKEARKGSRKKS